MELKKVLAMAELDQVKVTDGYGYYLETFVHIVLKLAA